ncbi:protein HAPLESS 2 [Cornus florida]|uniref:protein HAPLESS 2 n=1 Tax=Cornus florida TaxID=4283 RepID=UPI00289D4511|nr:protein HAPLESS 2 [Cornus florida]
MGNIIASFFSGLAHVIGNLFGSPLDFLAGKSCSSVCGSTWDFICYIDNFCIANLLKLAAVSALFYFVLLFFYLLYKLGICQCVGRTLCKSTWAFFAIYFSVCDYCCTFLCYKLRMLKQIHRKHRRRAREFDTGTSEQGSFSSHHRLSRHVKDRRRSLRDYRGDHLRRSLRPRSHRIRVGISGDSVYVNKRNPIRHGHHGSTVHDIRVTKTSKFAHKSANHSGATHRGRKRLRVP